MLDLELCPRCEEAYCLMTSERNGGQLYKVGCKCGPGVSAYTRNEAYALWKEMLEAWDKIMSGGKGVVMTCILCKTVQSCVQHNITEGLTYWISCDCGHGSVAPTWSEACARWNARAWDLKEAQQSRGCKDALKMLLGS